MEKEKASKEKEERRRRAERELGSKATAATVVALATRCETADNLVEDALMVQVKEERKEAKTGQRLRVKDSGKVKEKESRAAKAKDKGRQASKEPATAAESMDIDNETAEW